MKFIKRLLFFLIGLFLVLVLITFLLPKHAHIEREITIDAPASVVFNQVNELKNWNNWSTWLQMDPNMEITWGDKTSGQGASYSWDSDDKKVGKGSMSITESQPHSLINTAMRFEPDMDNEMYASMKFTETDGKTHVLWDFDGDFKGAGKWFGIMTDKMLGPQYEEGLANLKSVSEAAKIASPHDFGITLIDYPGESFAGVRSVVSFDDMSAAFEKGYGALGQAGIQPIGPAAGIYWTYDEEKKESDMAATFPVAPGGQYTAPIVEFNMPARKGAMLEYMGDYEQGYKAHMALGKYLTDKGLTQSGAVIEKYIVGPGQTENPKEFKTQIYYFYDEKAQ